MTMTEEETKLLTDYRRLTPPGKKLLIQTMECCVTRYGDGKIMFPAWKIREEDEW